MVGEHRSPRTLLIEATTHAPKTIGTDYFHSSEIMNNQRQTKNNSTVKFLLKLRLVRMRLLTDKSSWSTKSSNKSVLDRKQNMSYCCTGTGQ